MEYRRFPRSGEEIGMIGMGTAVIGERPEAEIIATVRRAVKEGVNYFDMAGGHAATFAAFGKALAGLRDQVFLQIHFGADYTSGEYGFTTDLAKIKKAVDWQLAQLQTDYIDVGFIHCMDEETDFEIYVKNGVLDYIKELKGRGVIRHIGLSSHTPAVVDRILDLGIVDVLMFSINPLYDYGKGDYGIGTGAERHALYCRCEKEGVAIVVMKPYCGGQLLSAAQSPFGVALTKEQCLQYALDKPGVVAVVPGFGSEAELLAGLAYLDATADERDYAILGGLAPDVSGGRCVYCKHCHPCPVGIDIGLVNKYYDLAMLGDNLAKEHYLTLEKKAGDCISCGHCDSRCPFRVAQSERMKRIKEAFGC